MKVEVIILFAFLISFADSAKILAVFPEPSWSHYAIGEAAMRALIEAGHEVTMISAFESKEPIEYYQQINIDNVDEAAAEGEPSFSVHDNGLGCCKVTNLSHSQGLLITITFSIKLFRTFVQRF